MLYRISLSLLVFSLLMLGVMGVCGVRCSTVLNEGLFFSKFTVLVVVFIASLGLSNDFIGYYASISQWFSYGFLMWQVIILIDLGYLWGIAWAEKYTHGSNCHAYLLIITTAVLYFLAIAINIASYWLGSDDSCSSYPAAITTLCLLAMLGCQLLNYNKQQSLLTTAALSLLTSYWLFASIFA